MKLLICRFDKAKERICAKYEEIERCLIQKFKDAYHAGNKREMKKNTLILANFKVWNSYFLLILLLANFKVWNFYYW